MSIALAVVGCGGASPGRSLGTSPGATAGVPSGAPPPSLASASGGPFPTPVEPFGPALHFAFASTTPVVTPALAGQPNEFFINPGAVIEHAGVLHMYANVFSAYPGHVDVMHLTSTDGRHWKLAQARPAFTSDAVADPALGMDVSGGFVDAAGTWTLLWSPVVQDKPASIGRITAPGPDGPWTVDPSPLLTAPASDREGYGWPSVIRTPGGFEMAFEDETAIAIGLATSPDGRSWTVRPQPGLRATRPWEQGGVTRPEVAEYPGGYLLVYATATQTSRGFAWSDDGIAWRKSSPDPTITHDLFAAQDQPYDHALIVRGQTATLLMEIGRAGAGGTNVFALQASLP